MKKAKKSVKKAVKPAAKKKAVLKTGSTKSALGRPYGDRVLVKPTPMEQTTSFGLIIPDSTKEKPETGVVVAVGDGRISADGKVMPMRVQVGDTIMFSKYGYDEVKVQGTDYYLIREESITYIF